MPEGNKKWAFEAPSSVRPPISGADPRSRGAIGPGSLQQFVPFRNEGAGNAGCPVHPQPRVQQKAHELVTTGPPESPGIPCAMVLTVSFVLSPAIGLSCHRHPRELGSRELDAGVEASGPHDFTVRFLRCSP